VEVEEYRNKNFYLEFWIP